MTATWMMRRRNGIGLADTLVAGAIRTGIPLIGALVIFALLDNNILNKAILSLAGYYLALFPCEVTLSMPRNKAVQTQEDQQIPKDDTNP
ncbi:MAG: hypothetical protein Q4G59_05615 [Planctomycetia bacterium]|nr:hypothetical protein [Planctomycetia bacterium]